MATNEVNGLLTVKDKDGNLYIVYPVTKLENISDLEIASASLDGLMSKVDKAKLDGVAAGAQKNTVTGVKGNAESSYRTGNINITPANIGAATSTDLSAHTGNKSNPHGVTKAQVGLGNADNTADSVKTVAKAAQLTTARKINGVDFNGTKDITIRANTASAKLTNENLDDIITEGFYYAASANTCTNKPSGVTYFGMHVIRTGESNGFVTQILKPGSTSGIYIRRRNDNTWSAWMPNAAYTNNPVSGQVVVADGTAGGIKTSGFTIAKSVPANAVFTDTNTTYSNMTAATASAAGKAGLVPAPAAGKHGQFLRGDGTWAVPANTTYGAATESANGLMSAADKAKLNKIGYVFGVDATGPYIEEI